MVTFTAKRLLGMLDKMQVLFIPSVYFSLTVKRITKDYTQKKKKKKKNAKERKANQQLKKPKPSCLSSLKTVCFQRSCPQVPSACYCLWKTAFDTAQTAGMRPEESLSDL